MQGGAKTSARSAVHIAQRQLPETYRILTIGLCPKVIVP